MKNKELYKDIMSNVQPSKRSVERIFDMTVDKKKSPKGLMFKRLASAALALALLVGGGFGANAIVQSQKDSNSLSVMVAYAGEYKSISDIKAGSTNEQSVFYSIHYADIENKEAVKNAKALFDKDQSTVSSQADELGDQGYTASVGTHSESVWSSEKDKETAIIYTVRGGSFALDLDDYSNVKTFTVENSNKLANLVFDCQKSWEALEKDVDNGVTRLGITGGHKFTLTGDELRASQDSKQYEGGTKHIVNKGYWLSWDASGELTNAIGNDLNFDLSQIKDTITFTVEFNDGTVKTASINLYFDSDGYMHFE